MTDGEAKGIVDGLHEENADTRNQVETGEPQRKHASAETWRRIEALATEYREKNPGVTPEETSRRIEALAAEYRRKNPGITPGETLKRIEALAAA